MLCEIADGGVLLMSSEDALALLAERCEKVLLVDVGARWGVQSSWLDLQDNAEILCFEPDEAECARLNKSKANNVRYLPYGLLDEEGVYSIYETIEPACSSLFPPLTSLYKEYPALYAIKTERVSDILCRTLDNVLDDLGLREVAAIKIDTQGSELAILKGSTKALVTCSLVDVEMEFNPIYEGQDLFCDVDKFMRDHGLCFGTWKI